MTDIESYTRMRIAGKRRRRIAVRIALLIALAAIAWLIGSALR